MLLYKKFLYNVYCPKNDWTEVHYENLCLSFRSKNQSPLIMIYYEYTVEITNFGKVIFQF